MDKVKDLGNELVIECKSLLDQLGLDEVTTEDRMVKYRKESLAGLRCAIKDIEKEIEDKSTKKTIKSKDIPSISIDPNLIIIRESCERSRKDLGDIDELTKSILIKGQISPILITRDNELIAGERRLRACQSIGIPVHAIYREDVDDITMKELELEENIQRKDMEWQERITLAKDITLLKQEKYGKKGAGKGQEGWSLGDTATLMGKSRAAAHQDMQLADAMERLPVLAKAKTADDAKKLLRKLEEELCIAELLKRDSKKPKAHESAAKDFILGDAFVELPVVETESIDFADVDTPYGIDLEAVKKSQTGTKELKVVGKYREWDKEKYLPSCAVAATEIYRILKPNSFCLWWFGMDYYAPLKELLSEVGFSLDPIPALWYAGAKAAQTNQPQIILGKSYDTFFLLRKGNPVLAKPGRHNVFEHPKVDAHNKIHPTEKPLPLYEEIVRMILFPGAKGIVPFLGSGNALRALYSNKCSGFGYDIPEQENVRNKFLLRIDEDIESGKYKGGLEI